MSGDIKQIPLNSSAIAGLWNAYMSEDIIVKILSYFLKTVECQETRLLLQQTSDLSKQHVTQITDLFNQAKLPIPEGFKNEDVNIDAPRLFSDTFYLAYLSFMSRIALHNYTIILSQIARSDIRDYFRHELNTRLTKGNPS